MISISVVMPTFNTPVEFLEEAVNSILAQTFRDGIIMKRAIYNSFTPDMSYWFKVKMFFQHLPFPLALRAAAGMSARTVGRRLHRQ